MPTNNNDEWRFMVLVVTLIALTLLAILAVSMFDNLAISIFDGLDHALLSTTN